MPNVRKVLMPYPATAGQPIPLFPNNSGRTQLTVGRSRTNDIVLKKPSISRMHAIITDQPNMDGVVIDDPGSRNGIFVKGHKIDHAYIPPNAMVSFGQSEFFYLQVLPVDEFGISGSGTKVLPPEDPKN